MTYRFSLAFLSFLVPAVCAVSGCGGDPKGGEGGSGGSTTTTTSIGTGGSGGSAGSAGTGGTNGTGAGGTGGTGAGGGTGGSGGQTSSNTGGGGNPGGQAVACDNLSCALPDTFCCQNYNEPAECLAPGAQCVYGVGLACDGPEDCQQGQVCCAEIATNGPANAYVAVACAATCTGKDYRVVCGASGACPQGDTCGTSDLLPPYLDCK